ncbi:MAG TPA: hypothetical protein VF517_14465 [Thermoleophilaceae bacterium]
MRTRIVHALRARAADESGLALVLAVMLTMLMLASAMALLAFTDNQTKMTGKERLRESTLTLAEGALNAQANLLSAGWPETSDKAFVPCTNKSTTVRCPDAGNLLRGFASKDFGNSAPISWNLSVRDNGLGSFYDDVATASQPAWDQSGPGGGAPDGVMWLRAQATIRGESRTIVSLIRATPIARAFPRGVLTAGHFHTLNNGNKQLLDTGSGPGVLARCTVGPGGPDRGNPCLDYQPTKGQVYPNSWVSDPSIPSAMSPNEIDLLRNRAKAANTWFSTCPSTVPTAPLVFVEDGSCQINSGSWVNSPAAPGMLVMYRGDLIIQGSAGFYGLIYAVNADNRADNLVTVTGGAYVSGAIVVDGRGGLAIDGNGLVLQYDSNAFNLVTTTQTINVIANSWRELNGH